MRQDGALASLREACPPRVAQGTRAGNPAPRRWAELRMFVPVDVHDASSPRPKNINQTNVVAPMGLRSLLARASTRSSEGGLRSLAARPNGFRQQVGLYGCGGPQPLAGEQVTGVPVRGYGLNPVFGRGHIFASSIEWI